MTRAGSPGVTAPDGPEGFAQVPEGLMALYIEHLSKPEIVTLQLLLMRQIAPGVFSRPADDMARVGGMAYDTVRRALSGLAKKGFITKRAGGHKGRTAEFVLTVSGDSVTSWLPRFKGPHGAQRVADADTQSVKSFEQRVADADTQSVKSFEQRVADADTQSAQSVAKSVAKSVADVATPKETKETKEKILHLLENASGARRVASANATPRPRQVDPLARGENGSLSLGEGAGMGETLARLAEDPDALDNLTESEKAKFSESWRAWAAVQA